jgi:hypothetical protein
MKQSVSIIREQLGLSVGRDAKKPEEAQPSVTAAREGLFIAAREQQSIKKQRLGVAEVTAGGELVESPLYGTYARRVPTSAAS